MKSDAARRFSCWAEVPDGFGGYAQQARSGIQEQTQRELSLFLSLSWPKRRSTTIAGMHRHFFCGDRPQRTRQLSFTAIRGKLAAAPESVK
jgi:hypothetical protein